MAKYLNLSDLRQTMLFALWRSVLILVIVVLYGCSNKPDVLAISGSKMGTTYHITVIADQLPPDDLEQQIDQLLSKVDNSMSTYKKDSEISRFNRLPVGKSMTISDEFLEVVKISQKIWQLSNGAFDPTIGPLVDLWGFGPGERLDAVPTPHAIAQAKAEIGFDSVVLAENTLSKTKPVALDLSAVAKGYAVDRVADLLEMLALPDYLVEIGGEIRVSGFNADGVAWRIAMEQPQLFAEVDQVIAITDIAVATSGDYRNYFEQDGVRYSHTIDPKTGMPIDHNLASVTVLSESCAVADAWATAFSVLGAEKSLELAEQLDLSAYMLVRDNGVFVPMFSSGFDFLVN
ncbi:MAG: FAD:protein FMN transferase [Porticoccaceae bacterium]